LRKGSLGRVGAVRCLLKGGEFAALGFDKGGGKRLTDAVMYTITVKEQTRSMSGSRKLIIKLRITSSMSWNSSSQRKRMELSRGRRSQVTCVSFKKRVVARSLILMRNRHR
jgi:hypothetical protein